MALDPGTRLLRFTALLEASPDSVAVVGLDGYLEFLNGTGRRLVGVADDADVTTLRYADLLTPTGLAAMAQLQRASENDLGRWVGETELRGSDGGGIPVVMTSFPLDDEEGKTVARAYLQRDLRETHGARAEAPAARQALRDDLERQRSLLRHMGDVLVVVDVTGALQYASPSATRLLGFADDEPVAGGLLRVIHPDDRALTQRALAAAAARPGPGEPVLVRLLLPCGETVPFEALPTNLLHEPSVGGIVVVARNVTERQRGERALQAQARVLELIASGSALRVVLEALSNWVEQTLQGTRCSILLVEADPARDVLRDAASPSMPAEYREAVDGLPVAATFSPCAVAITSDTAVLVRDLLAEDQWAPMHGLATQIGVRSCWSFPVTSPASGATLGSFALYRKQPGLPDQQTTLLMDRASHLVGIAVDRHQLVSRLDHQARHDALTGLPNRMELLERLTHRLATCRPDCGGCPVVVFLDLDRLKVINDSLGHEIGDELLVATAGRLRAAISPEDLVARFGGDEFVVLSAAGSDDVAVVDALVTGILEVVSEPIVLDGRLITPAASAGVVVASPGQTATEVLRDADIAMYRAKHAGGGSYALFGADMRQRAFDRLDVEGQLRHAIAHDEFRVYYQPIVDMRRKDRLVGFEALVRWQHPQRGLLAPAQFLDLAEETGLIVPLGEWVLRTAVATAERWTALLPTEGLTMSVNLAAQQLQVAGLSVLVQECTDAVAPWTLGLEFTESALMDDTLTVSTVVDELAATGARLSIDDFGTGFSSLSYLTRLPVRRLKIDRSFVAELETKPEATTVVSAIIGLAGELGLTVVAEGIETAEQRASLLLMGCRFAQGYLFSRPLPEPAALALLEKRNA